MEAIFTPIFTIAAAIASPVAVAPSFAIRTPFLADRTPIPRRPYPIPRRPRRIPRNLRRDGRKVVSAVGYSHFGLCRNCIAACNSRFAPRNDSRCHLGHDWHPRRRGACCLCPDGDGGESG